MLSRQLEIIDSLELRNELRNEEVNLGVIRVQVKGETMWGVEIIQNENIARGEKQVNDRTSRIA